MRGSDGNCVSVKRNEVKCGRIQSIEFISKENVK